MSYKVGITTTVPVEVVYAAGCVPVDLNNIFITDNNPQQMVEDAELAGYPRNICSWIKGIYSAVMREKEINRVIAVTQGDCSNTHALMETLHLEGVEIIPFAYPYNRDRDMLRLQMEKLMEAFGVDWVMVNNTKAQLDEVRTVIHRIDDFSWRNNLVGGFDNHLWQVCCSDFNGDPQKFCSEAEAYVESLKGASPRTETIRLGYIGVPPIMTDLYDYLESRGARIVFNEIQRQFAMPFATDDLIEQYAQYTYPYDIFWRLEDIRRETRRRGIQGIVHYAQSFCYRQIQDLIIRRKIGLPVLTIEGDRPLNLDARTKMRIDGFVEMLR